MTCENYLTLFQISIVFKKITMLKRIILRIQKTQDRWKKKREKYDIQDFLQKLWGYLHGETSREKSIREKEDPKDIKSVSKKITYSETLLRICRSENAA